jgi:hypothetical protein
LEDLAAEGLEKAVVTFHYSSTVPRSLFGRPCSYGHIEITGLSDTVHVAERSLYLSVNSFNVTRYGEPRIPDTRMTSCAFAYDLQVVVTATNHTTKYYREIDARYSYSSIEGAPLPH